MGRGRRIETGQVVAHLVLAPGHEIPPLVGGQVSEGTAQYRLAEQIPELEHALVRPLGVGAHRTLFV